MTSRSQKKKKKKRSFRDSESLVVQQQTHIRLISWSKQSEIVKGGPPPLIGHGPDIPVCVYV